MRKTTFNQTNVFKTLCSLSLLLLIATQTIAQNTSHIYFWNGNPQRVELGDVLEGFSNATFEAWVYIADDGGNAANTVYHEICGKGNVNSFSVRDDSQSGSHNLHFNVGDGSSWPTSGLYSSTAIAEKTWTHVAVTWNGSTGETIMYINGVQDTTGTISVPGNVMGSNTSARAIADYGGGTTSNRLDGSIDELRVWSVVRTPAEISSYYLRSVASNATGLEAYYNFNEYGGSTLGDSTSNNYDGTLIGLTTSDATPGDGSNGNWFTGGPSIDDTAPVISIVGESTINVALGSTYTDLGATATDNVDGTITGNITTNNPVNTAVAGTYTVTYDVNDNAGNSASQVSRTVIVWDVALGANPTNATCLSATDGSVVLTPSGGTAPYVYGETLFFNNFLGAADLSGFTNTNMIASTSGTDLSLNSTVADWANNSFISNQSFTREQGLTFEGSIFIPIGGYKAYMVGFNDGLNSGTTSVLHGLYFFDNGGDVSVSARFGADAVAMPTATYANQAAQSPGSWFDYKITLDAANGATYSVKRSSESNYTNTINDSRGSSASLKIGVQATLASGGGTQTASLHKNWRVYKTPTSTSNLAVGSYTYHVTDANGFKEQVTVNIANGDTTDPGITITNGSSTTHEAYTTYTDAGATATDNCSGASITNTVNNVPANPAPGTYTVVYTATDSAGNTSTATRTVTVSDTTNPTAVAKDITVALDGAGSVTITGAQVNNNSTDNSGETLTYSVSPNTFGCANVNQDCGAVSLNIGAGTYAGNANGPAITDISDAGFTLEAWIKPTGSLSGVYSIIRKDGDYNLYLNNGGLTADVWNDSDNLFSISGPTVSPDVWTHVAFVWNGSAGTFYVNGTAGSTGSPSNRGLSPQTSPFDLGRSINHGQPFYGNIDDVRLWSVTRSGTEINDNYAKCLLGNETGLQIYYKTLAGTGTILKDYSPNGYDATIVGGTWSNDAPPLANTSNVVTLTVTDPSGNTDTATATITVEDNIAPVITITNGGATSHEAYTTYTDAGATIVENCSYTLTTDNQVPSNPAPGTYSVIYTARDTGGNEVTATRTVTVTDTTDPTAVAKDVTVQLDASGNGTLTASQVNNGSSDNSGGSLTLSLSKTSFTCSDLNFVGSPNSALSFNGGRVDLPAIQPRGASSELTIEAWIKPDLASFGFGAGEIINSMQNGTTNPGEFVFRVDKTTGQLSFLVIDSAAGFNATTSTGSVTTNTWTHVAVTYDGTDVRFYINGVLDGSAINLGKSITGGVPYIASIGSKAGATQEAFIGDIDEVRLWSTTRTQQEINDNRNSKLTGSETGLYTYYPFDENTGTSTTDASTNSFNGTLTGTLPTWTTSVLGGGSNTQQVTLTVEDPSGNTSTATATVTVEDNVNPVITVTNGTSTSHEAYTAYTDAGATVTDNCSGSLTGTVNNVPANPAPGTYTVVYTATDGSGNTSTATRTVTVTDTTNPVASAQNLTIQLDASGNATITGAQVNDGSTDNSGGTLTYSVTPNSFTCANLGTNNVTLTVTDPSNNTDTASAVITIQDNIDPVISITNGNVTHEAYTTYTDDGATVTDNCSASITNTVNNVPANPAPGTYTVVYTATDAGNNVVTATRTVTVVDTTPPVAIAQDITVQLDATGNATITGAQVNNGSTDTSNGTLTYSVSPSTFDCGDLTGPTTYSADFDGINDFASVALDGTTLTDFTYEVNMRYTARQDGAIALWGNAVTDTDPYMFLYFQSAGNLVLKVDRTFFVMPGVIPDLNTWYHIAVTYDSTDWKVYVNGTLINTFTAGAWQQFNANNIFIGSSAAGYFTGQMDEIRVWNDVRTQTEISTNLSSTVDPGSSNLIGYYRFDEGTGTAFSNLAGGGSGTMHAGATWSTETPFGSSGNNQVTLTVTDPSNNSSTATATVTVQDNINPTITLNGSPNMTVTMPNSFTDPGATAADNCSATVQVTGSVDVNTPGTYTLSYKAIDGSGNESNVITRSVFVNGLPSASDDTTTVNEGTTNNSINVFTNDSFGPDGGGSISITTPPTNGTASVNGTTIEYTPTARATSDTLIYTVQDSNGDTASATVTITINRIPSGTDSTFSVEEDSTNNNLDATSNNDFDLDGVGSIALLSGTSSQGGTVSINDQGTTNDVSDDTFTYTPAVGFVGADSFQYTITDGNGDTSSAITVNVNVTAVVPVAANDTPTVKEDYTNVTLDILANDTFRDTATDDLVSFTISGATASQGGSITINTNGTTDPADDTVTYTPVTQFVGQETFTYTLTDANGDSDSGTVTISVVPVIPQPKDDTFTVNRDTENHVFNLFADNGNGADVYETTSPDTLTSFTLSGTITTESGTAIIDDKGTTDPWDDTVTYSPRAAFEGTDSFTYTLLDENGDSATATVTIIVRPIVPVPVDDTATVNENSANNIINVLSNDDFGGNGPNGTHPLTFSNGSKASASDQGGTIVVGTNGTPNDLTDDVILYTPAPNFTGVDTFKYVITDSDGDATSATVTVTVSAGAGSTLPTANNDSVTVNSNSTANVINVLVNDDPGLDGYIANGLTMTNGTSSGGSVNGGTVSVDNKNTDSTADDVINYTPAAGFTGTDSFQYTITDDSGDAATATVNITVNAVTDVPNAVDDTATIDQNSSNNDIDVLANDSAGTDGLAILTLSGGGVTAQGGTVGWNLNGTSGDLTDDTVTYTPATGFLGEDSFTYTIEDGNGDTSTATVVITVVPVVTVNGTPSAVDDTATANQNGSAVNIMVLANDDFGTDGPNTTHALTFSNGSISNASANGASIVVHNNGTTTTYDDDYIVYTPSPTFNGTDSFTYVITDENGDASSATVTITVGTSGSGGSTPTANDDTVTVLTNSTSNVIDVLDNDTPGTDGYIIGGLTMTNGTLTSASSQGGSISIDNKGTDSTLDDVFNYTPPVGFTGTDTFQYTITDASGDADTGTVTVTVNAITNDPVAGDDNASVVMDSSNNVINMLTNDSFGTDGQYSPPVSFSAGLHTNGFYITTITTAQGGTAVLTNNDSEIHYTPASGFTGTDSFVYYIYDGNGDRDGATVNITVTATPVVNGTPTAVDDTATASQGGSDVNISVLTNDSFGTDGPNTNHSLTFSNGSTTNASANGATVTVNNNGTTNNYTDDYIVYSPTATFSGTDTFTYVITDTTGDASTATVTVTVSGGGGVSIPVANDDAITVDRNTASNSINVLANDAIGSNGFISGHGLRLEGGLSQRYTDQGGFLTINENSTPNDASDDTIEYTPAPNYSGADTFSYIITDTNGVSDTATVSITVQIPKPSAATPETTFNNNFTVYPNPSKGFVKTTVESNSSGKANVYLVDVTGKIIFKSEVNLIKGNNNLEFNFRVSTGVMYLKIIGNTNYGTKKIIFE